MAANNDFSGHVISLASFMAILALSWLVFRKLKDDWDREHQGVEKLQEQQPGAAASLASSLISKPSPVLKTVSKGMQTSASRLSTPDYLRMGIPDRLRIAERLANVSINGGLSITDQALLDSLLASLAAEPARSLSAAIPKWLRLNGYSSILQTKIANTQSSQQQSAFMTRLGSLNLVKINLPF